MIHVRKILENSNCWRFDLRIRYFPSKMEDMAGRDRPTFSYLFEQLKHDYINGIAEHVDSTSAIQLGCLNARKLFRDLNFNAVDKRANVTYLEREAGLKNFFPLSLIQNSKTKVLRRIVKAYLKEYEEFDDMQCMLRYCHIMKSVWSFDQETFECNLGFSTEIKIDLIIAPAIGINYGTRDTSSLQLFSVAHFNQISSVAIHGSQTLRGAINIHLFIIDSCEPFVIMVTDQQMARSICDLIDGYCRLQVKTALGIHDSAKTSLIESYLSGNREDTSPKATSVECISEYCQSLAGVTNLSAVNQAADQSDVRREQSMDPQDYKLLPNSCFSHLDCSQIIQRSCINLIEEIGHGNFGHVYRGRLLQNGQQLDVAVKVGQDHEARTIEKFLLESSILVRFDHPHIISMIGICPVVPILIVMELARYGELRKFLSCNGSKLSTCHLLLYCCQLCSALDYLESRRYVHRDIAARNLLVTDHHCVKLADFGLSRELEDNYYKASKGKLPIRWMAPESINYRRFTHSSDVWMFGVCMWEIMSVGKKPYANLTNSLIMSKLESGQHLEQPDSCPDVVYGIMEKCWQYDPKSRPCFADLTFDLRSALNCIKRSELAKRGSDVVNSRALASDDHPHSKFQPETLVNANPPLCHHTGVPDQESESWSDVGLAIVDSAEPQMQWSHYKFHVISNLHTRTKQVAGAILLLNFTISSRTADTISELIIHVKSMVIAVKELFNYVKFILGCALNKPDFLEVRVANHQQRIAMEMKKMVNDLRISCIKNLVECGVNIARSSKSIFCELLTFLQQCPD